MVIITAITTDTGTAVVTAPYADWRYGKRPSLRHGHFSEGRRWHQREEWADDSLLLPLLQKEVRCRSRQVSGPRDSAAGAGEREEEVPVQYVHVGDVLRVLPRDKVPLDGEVFQGQSSLDEAMISVKECRSRKGRATKLSAAPSASTVPSL